MTNCALKPQYQVFRHVCPRNCFDTCGILSYVQDGAVKKVAGDPEHGYSQGRLCAKGYAFTQYLYSPYRLRYPLRQVPRGSGVWQRISWEEAYTIICDKIFELNQRYGSNLALSYNKYSGNIGLLHQAVEGMFNGLGSHTKPLGNPCAAAGIDAISYDFGALSSPDPESMAEAQVIVIWGANPAITAVNQYHFINIARQQGAKVVVIDPLFTPSAAKADLYLQIKPGSDGMLALAVAKLLVDRGAVDWQFIRQHVLGWEPFARYLREYVSLSEASNLTGIPEAGIRELADLYCLKRPLANWIGIGVQRYKNGGQNIRAIDALAAITGNIGLRGGGVYYFYPMDELFPRHLLNFNNEKQAASRVIDLNHFAEEALNLQNPPVKFLWIASRNPLTQDTEHGLWEELLRQLELVVTVELYMTKTAEKSDLVLPAATHFEAYDLNISYWHRWVGLNQKAIEPWYEAKSDLQIAQELSGELNQRLPGFSSFPQQVSALEWIAREFTPEVLAVFGLNSWQELFDGPRKLKVQVPWHDLQFATPSGKFELFSLLAKGDNLPALPRFRISSPGDDKQDSVFPLRLLTPQTLLRIHSQYEALAWLTNGDSGAALQMSDRDAWERGLQDGDWITVFNGLGSVNTHLSVNSTLPQGVVVAQQGSPVSALISYQAADMGRKATPSNGVAYFDTLIDIRKAQVTLA